MSARQLIIAIDGPAGAGKSTLARALARKLGYLYINTGAMYRAIAWQAMKRGLRLDDETEVGGLAVGSKIDLRGTPDDMHVVIDGCDVTAEIRLPEVAKAASIVSALPAVRRALVARQKEMGAAGGIVMEGRDIGSTVFPLAEVKIFLDASTSARSRRRHRQDRGAAGSLAQTKSEIEERDRRDSTRLDSPLMKSEDAHYLDSSGLSIDEVVARALELVVQAQSGQV